MLHWTPARTATSSITPIGGHARRILRRRGPQPSARIAGPTTLACWPMPPSGVGPPAATDGDYWKACAPAAIAKAAAIRTGSGFPPLP